MSAYTCDVCRYDGGVHWSDDLVPVPSPCPNRLQTEQAQHVEQLVAAEHNAARDAARAIVRDAADRLAVFSANNLRDEIRAAQLDDRGGLMGAAFSYAARQGWVEWTGRMVSSEGTAAKGHKIMEYKSLRYRREATG